MVGEKKLADAISGTPERKQPIGKDFFLPNRSGDLSQSKVLSTPVSDTDIPNKKYVDDNVADLDALASDLIATIDNTYDLGSSAKRWAQGFIVALLVTSMVIGSAIKLEAIDGVLFINASTDVNGTLDAWGVTVNDTSVCTGENALCNQSFTGSNNITIVGSSISINASFSTGAHTTDTNTQLTETQVRANATGKVNSTGWNTTTATTTTPSDIDIKGNASVSGNFSVNGLGIRKINSSHWEISG